MVVKTKFFGELEISEKDIIIFDEGLPGFQDMHRYAVINDEDNPYKLFAVPGGNKHMLYSDSSGFCL